MGCTQSHEDSEAKARNAEIEEQLKRDRQNMAREIKMLLLGAGESGKSTVLKQMRLIYNKPYDAEERDSYREIVYSNTVQSMRVLLEGVVAMGLDISSANQAHYNLILAAPALIEGDRFPPTLANAIKGLWQDEGVREAFSRRNELQLNDSAPYGGPSAATTPELGYGRVAAGDPRRHLSRPNCHPPCARSILTLGYFDAIARLANPAYVPTDQDILRARVKTTGITETHFQIGELKYKLFDVGGQRSERRKWLGVFENVTALVFLIAISEYDQMLYEDETVNRMTEAMTLFESVANSRWFIKTSIILFLNKIDLFRAKLPHSPLANTFPEYKGGANYDAACAFLLEKFVALNQNPSKSIYAHYTDATDTRALAFVVSAVHDVIIQVNLRECGLL